MLEKNRMKKLHGPAGGSIYNYAIKYIYEYEQSRKKSSNEIVINIQSNQS